MSPHRRQTDARQETRDDIHSEPPSLCATRRISVSSSQAATRAGCSRSISWANASDSDSSITSFRAADVHTTAVVPLDDFHSGLSAEVLVQRGKELGQVIHLSGTVEHHVGPDRGRQQASRHAGEHRVEYAL